METKRPNSSCSKKDHEDIIIETQRIRTTKSTDHTCQDHIADRGHVSMSHNNMVQKRIPTPKAVTIPAATIGTRVEIETITCVRIVELETSQIIQDSRATITSNIPHSPHMSASVFLTLKTLSIHGHRDLTLSSKSGVQKKNFASVMASSRYLTRFGEGPMAQPYAHTRSTVTQRKGESFAKSLFPQRNTRKGEHHPLRRRSVCCVYLDFSSLVTHKGRSFL